MTKTKGIEYERLTMNSHRPKAEFENFGQALKEFGLMILIVGVLYIILNLVLGWN